MRPDTDRVATEVGQRSALFIRASGGGTTIELCTSAKQAHRYRSGPPSTITR
jgi:hypothetical protein